MRPTGKYGSQADQPCTNKNCCGNPKMSEKLPIQSVHRGGSFGHLL